MINVQDRNAYSIIFLKYFYHYEIQLTEDYGGSLVALSEFIATKLDEIIILSNFVNATYN